MPRFTTILSEELKDKLDANPNARKNLTQFVREAIVEKLNKESTNKDKSDSNSTEQDIIESYFKEINYTYKNYFEEGNRLTDDRMNGINAILLKEKRMIGDDIVRSIVIEIMKKDKIYLSRLESGLIGEL